jgi:hypothetical protein
MAKKPYHVDDLLRDLAKAKEAEKAANIQQYEGDVIYFMSIFYTRFQELLKILDPSISFDENEECFTIQDHANSIDKCFVHLIQHLKARNK